MNQDWPEQTRLFWKIRDIHHIHRNLLFHLLSENGLHFGQPRMLATIERMQGATQKEIAEALHTTPASFATSIKRMEKAGLLQKITDRQDLRRNSVALTDRGREVLEASHRTLKGLDTTLFEGFSDEERRQLAAFLDRIADRMAALTPEGIELTHPHPHGKHPRGDKTHGKPSREDKPSKPTRTRKPALKGADT